MKTLLRSTLSCGLLLLLVAHAGADERDAEIARLKSRVVALETEIQSLHQRLSQIAALSVVADAEPLPKLTIMLPSDDWGDAQQPDVLKVLYSSASPIWQSAGKPPLHRISVVRDAQGPLVAYQRGPANSYKVLLDVQGRLWAKMTYQFSHEMCHILANYRDGPNKQKWLEESICECASLYTLRATGKSWKTSPPYPNWKSYADALTEYANNRIGEAVVVPQDDLAKWYPEHRAALEAKSTKRDLNLVVAVRLLKIFEEHPNSWRVVRSLNVGDPAENESLDVYLAAWHSRVSDADQQVVHQIAELFGITLPQLR